MTDNKPSRLVVIASLLVIALLLGLAVVALRADPLATFLRVISIGAVVLMVLSVAIMLLTFRKARKISPLMLSISVAISVLCLTIYSLILNVSMSFGLWMLALIAGGALGVAWSITNTLFNDAGTIKARGNIWYLAIWAAVFAINQLVTIVTGRPPFIAIVMLLISTGLVLGNTGGILRRYYHVREQVKNKALGVG
jgi:hypothetical protein